MRTLKHVRRMFKKYAPKNGEKITDVNHPFVKEYDKYAAECKEFLDDFLLKRRVKMPLTAKGKKIHKTFVKQYGAKKADKVFYAMINEGKLKGVEVKKRKAKKK